MLRRRDRKRRNQRIAAGVVGIAVFVATVWIVTTGLSLDRSEKSIAPGGEVTGPAKTGPQVVTEPAETGVENPEHLPVVEPLQLGTVTNSGGGCTLQIDAETIRPGAGRLTVVNEKNRPVSFDLFRITSGRVQTIERLEAFVASEKRYLPNGRGPELLSPPTGAILMVQREVRAGASGTITDNFTTGAFAVMCAYPDAGIDIFRYSNSPFALVGPIVVT